MTNQQEMSGTFRNDETRTRSQGKKLYYYLVKIVTTAKMSYLNLPSIPSTCHNPVDTFVPYMDNPEQLIHMHPKELSISNKGTKVPVMKHLLFATHSSRRIINRHCWTYWTSIWYYTISTGGIWQRPNPLSKSNKKASHSHPVLIKLEFPI